jgi:uncharacterized repeat protein (TIGR02543 family)
MLVSSPLFVTAVTTETFDVEDLSTLEAAINYANNHPTVHMNIHISNGNIVQLPNNYDLIIPFNVWLYIDYGAEFAINGGNTKVHNAGVIFIDGIINHSSNIYNNSGGKIFLGDNCQIKGNAIIVVGGEPPIYLANYWLVTFIANDGTFDDGRLKRVVEVPKTQPIVPEEKIPLTLIIDNLSFECWFENSNGEKWDSTASITTNIELYAVLATNTVKYTVIYDPGTHGIWNAIDETYIVYANDPIPTFGTNSKADVTIDHDTDWIFTGWNPSWTAMVTDSVTYVAQWIQEIVPIPDLKVTYHNNGASIGNVPIDNNRYDSGEHVTIAGNIGGLAKPGYTFTGWAYNPNTPTADFIVTNNSIIPATFDIYENVNLYAIWTPTNYTVTYNGNGHTSGSAPIDNNSPYLEGTWVTILNQGNIAKTGYTFLGWSQNPTANTATVTAGSTLTIYNDIELYAVWSENTYTITYQPGTHGTFTPQTTTGLHYGDPTPTPPTPITGETGWTFTGWTTDPSATVTSNTTYIAQWIQTTTPSLSPSPPATITPPPDSPSPTPPLSTSPSPGASPTFTPPNTTDFPDDGVNRLFIMLIIGTISAVVLTVTIVWKGLWKKNDKIDMQKNVNKELEQSWFTQLNTTIRKVSSKIVLYFGKILYFLTASSLFLALNFALVVYFSTILYDATITPINLLLAALITIAIYSLNKVTDRTEDAINKPDQKTKNQSYFIIPATVCYISALIVGITEGIQVVLVLLVPLIMGIIYSVKISKSLPRLKEIIGIKNVAVAFSWAFTGSLLPALIATVGHKEIILVFIYIFIQLFINTVLFDIIDVTGDNAAGVKTIPLRLKTEKNIQHFLLIINSLLLIWLTFCFISNTFTKYLPVTIFGVLYSYVTIYYFTSDKKTKRLLAEILIDGQWIPIVVFMWLLILY